MPRGLPLSPSDQLLWLRTGVCAALAASCLCHQVRLGLLSGWTMNTWSRFARQKEERTSSALIAAALHSAPAELPADFCRQVCRVREAGWWLVRARNTTTNNSTTAHGSTRSALLALLCGFSPALLLPRRPIRRSYALHRPASFCTTVRCYKLAAAQLYCGAYNKAVGCPEARLSHPRIQRSYALYPPGV